MPVLPHEYPEYLIPQDHFREEILVDDLLESVPELEVVRRSDKVADQTFNELGILREDVLSRSDLPGLSLHLFGGGLRVEDIKFRQKKPASDPWPASQLIDPESLLQHVDISEVFTPVFFKIKDLHRKNFPYTRSGDDKEAKKLMIHFPEKSIWEIGKEAIQFTASSEVAHAPALLNYWHAELRFRDVAETSIRKTNSAWQKNAMKSALTHLVTNSAYPQAQYPELKIPQELYVR